MPGCLSLCLFAQDPATPMRSGLVKFWDSRASHWSFIGVAICHSGMTGQSDLIAFTLASKTSQFGGYGTVAAV